MARGSLRSGHQGQPGPARPAANTTRLVVTSVFALAVRSTWQRALSLLSTLVVARLLVPADLGRAAIVISTTTVASMLIDAAS